MAKTTANFAPTIKYALMTLKHKYFVFVAGLKTGAKIWDLLIHDLSKLSPSELPHYGRQFFGAADDPLGFTYCWNHHQKANRHHWEYWIPETSHSRGGYQDREPLPMPDRYCREMVADWLGASRTYEGRWPKSLATWPWLQSNFSKCRLHPDTRVTVMEILKQVMRAGL